MEIRLLTGAEVRPSDEGSEKGFEGRLVPYGIEAPIGGRFVEVIARGCFTKSIKEAAHDLPLLTLHDATKLPVGKAVEWDDRADGLYGRWVMAETVEARQVHQLVTDGFLRGLSCGFVPMRDQETWEARRPPELTRVTRRQARLAEASLVPTPTWAEAVVLVTRSSVAEKITLTPHRTAWAEWLETVRQAPRA